MEYALVAALWAGYCALHSFLISITVTNLMSRMLKDYYAFYRIAYVVISLALLVPLIRFSIQIETPIVISSEYPLSLIRTMLVAVSLAIFFWAFFFDYDALTFFGIRQVLDFRKPSTRDRSGDLKKNGLLGIIRHPMYFALLIFLWCQTETAMDIVVNIVLTAYVIIGTKLEERKLVVEFGETYVRYQHEVPMLIPFTHAA